MFEPRNGRPNNPDPHPGGGKSLGCFGTCFFFFFAPDTTERRRQPPLTDFFSFKLSLSFKTSFFSCQFKALKINDVDPSACVNDVAGAGKYLRDFATDLKTSNYTKALDDLGQGISSMSTSVSGCGVKEVESKLDALAAAIKWAKISKLDSVVKVIVGAADLEKDLQALATAVVSGDATNIGNALGDLLDQWTAVTGGCTSGSKACTFIDGLLRIVQTVAVDYAPCASAIEPAYAQFEDGVAKMHSQNVTGAVADFASGLDTLAKALDNDSCGLQNLASVLSKVAPKLAAAIVKDNTVVVEYADVYDEIFAAAVAVEDGDVVAFGMAVGRMLQSLRASSCKTVRPLFVACCTFFSCFCCFRISFEPNSFFFFCRKFFSFSRTHRNFVLYFKASWARCNWNPVILLNAPAMPIQPGPTWNPPFLILKENLGDPACPIWPVRFHSRPKQSTIVVFLILPKYWKTPRRNWAIPVLRPRLVTCPVSWWKVRTSRINCPKPPPISTAKITMRWAVI